VLASAALAYVLNPLVEIFQRRGFSRLWAALLALLLVTLAIAGFLWFVVPDLWDESVKASESILRAFTEQNAKNARAYIRDMSPLVDRIIGYPGLPARLPTSW
jgi:predicted PurR-regulated permease PerM